MSPVNYFLLGSYEFQLFRAPPRTKSWRHHCWGGRQNCRPPRVPPITHATLLIVMYRPNVCRPLDPSQSQLNSLYSTHVAASRSCFVLCCRRLLFDSFFYCNGQNKNVAGHYCYVQWRVCTVLNASAGVLIYSVH